MKLARFVSPLSVRTVASYFVVVLRLCGAVFLLPLAVALLAVELREAAFFGGVAIVGLGLGQVAQAREIPEIGRREALVVIGIAYLLFAILGAVPFLGVASFDDALFESMSGFTTTGLTVLVERPLPTSLIFFRSYAQWIGGAGIVILSLVFLLPPGQAAFQLYAARFSEDRQLGSVIHTARTVAIIYTSLTVVGFLAYFLAGMPAFDSLIHVLSTVSTGGFSPYGDSIQHYGSAPLAMTVTIFMLLGATSFPLFYFARTEGARSFLGDLQLRYLLGSVGVGAAVWLTATAFDFEALVEALFHSASAFTTAGFTVSDPSEWPTSSRWVAIVGMVVGGSTGSTAGGIKLIRLIIVWRLLSWLVLKRSLPSEAKVPLKYGSVTISSTELMEVSAFLVLYAALLVGSTGLLTLAGFGVGDALFESASALGTVGLSTGVTTAALPIWAKAMLIVDMWAGRLEIVPLLLIFNPLTWWPARR